MKKSALLSLLILFFIAASKCFGAAVLDSSIIINIPAFINVKALNNAKNDSVINPFNGTHDGLEAVFNIKTNGDDNIYDFVLTSSIDTQQGAKSGYFLNGDDLYLMLANKECLPDINSINDITSNNLERNLNVIAYPIFKNPDFNFQNYNNIPSIKYLIKDRHDVNIRQIVGTTPLNETYSTHDDKAGTYEAIVTLNVYRKP